MTALVGPIAPATPVRPRSIAAGAVGASVLIALYLTIISLAQGLDHAIQQLEADALFVALITIGFGTQVALFTELRAVDREHRAAAAVTVTGTGTSAAAMLACCAHHLVDLLPLVGLSAAAVFLNAFKMPLLIGGIGLNILGIVVIARQLRRARRACALATESNVAQGAPAGG